VTTPEERRQKHEDIDAAIAAHAQRKLESDRLKRPPADPAEQVTEPPEGAK
jgi:hypothetical protein